MPQGPGNYIALLGDIKQRIRHAQARAWMAVNAELIHLYWCIGRSIDSRQQAEGYGTAVIPRLARDLHNELPEVKGFSERNIKRMLAFYRLYPNADLETEVVPQLVAQLLLSVPWGHHAVLMEKVKDAAARQWYMRAFALGWPDLPFVQQVLHKWPWGHNLALLDKLNPHEPSSFQARRVVSIRPGRSPGKRQWHHATDPEGGVHGDRQSYRERPFQGRQRSAHIQT